MRKGACAEPAENWNPLKGGDVILDRHDGRDQGTSLWPPNSVTRMAGASASFSIFCRNR